MSSSWIRSASLKKLSAALVDGNKALPGIQELKEWQGLVKYVRSFPDSDGNGIPDVPEKYKGTLGRIVEKPSFSPVNLMARATTPTLIVLALSGMVLLLIIAAIAVIQKRRKVQIKV
jgi:hypothetical protein